jgi:protein involved in polysaccharide export with SLBB domain
VIRDSTQVIISLEDNLRGGTQDFLIRAGDQISVPKKPGVVLVTGNVALDGFIEYEKGKRVKYYLDRAGGLQPNTAKYFQLTQANGATFRVKRKGLLRDNPVVDDGAILRAIFELEPEKEPFDMREVIVELTSLTTSALTLYFLIDRITTQ